MADISKAISAIKESRPPATDRFTYLTIIQSHLSPDLLPALNDVLQDAQLTQDIGWDLVEMLVPLPGCEACLETIARLGNPREVLLKALEALEGLQEEDGYESDNDDDDDDKPAEATMTEANHKAGAPPSSSSSTSSSATHRFNTLLGVLAICHKRLTTNYPSRFLATTLTTVYRVYRPNPEMTAAVVELVASLSGRRRPPLPTRKSSVNVTSPDKDGDTSRNLPDPEADKDAEEAPTDPDEDEMQRRLLLSFVSCVLERYVNENDVAWAPRLLEYYNPTRLVPGRRSMLQAFREDKELLVRDAVVGNLVAVTRDLGLTTCSPTFVKQLVEGPVRNDPLGTLDETAGLDDVSLSTGGSICLVAYWVFSSAVFDADQPKPDMYIFPEHAALLGRLLQDDAQAAIQGAPGTSEAVVAIGLWLEDNKRISASPAALPTTAAPGAATTTKTTAVAVATADDEEEGRREANFMSYHHLLTLVAVYHPSLAVRNAACALAGAVLHDDPSEQDRLRILEDLLENCMFANLKACAVSWLRDELLAATATGDGSSSGSTTTTAITATTTGSSSAFAGTEALEALQYALFPDLAFLADLDGAGLREYWEANAPFVLQAVNLALLLWSGGGGGGAGDTETSQGGGGGGRLASVVPAHMHAAVAERWAAPLWTAAASLAREKASGGADDEGFPSSDLEVLRERLRRLADTEAFRPLGLGDGEGAA